MDDVAGEERKRLETIESELADVRGRLDRLYDLVETTTEFNMADFAHRIRDHKERQQRLESAAEGARAILAQRRAVLDDVKTITAYAQDMNRFLQKSELTERRAFIETFVREIELLPDNAVVRYSVPMPDDSLIPGKKVQEIPLNGSVVSSVNGSPLERTRTRVCRVPTVDSPPSDDWGRASREGTSAPADHRSPRVNASAYSPTDAGRRRTAGSASCANRNLFNHQQGEAEPRPQALTSMRSRAPRITHSSTGGSSLPTQGAGQVLEMQESSLGPRP